MYLSSKARKRTSDGEFKARTIVGSRHQYEAVKLQRAKNKAYYESLGRGRGQGKSKFSQRGRKG